MASTQLYLDPLNQNVLNLIQGTPGVETMSVQKVRDMFRQATVHEQVPGVNRTKIEVPVWNGTQTWIYRPEESQKPLSYIFFIHGGGYVSGDIDVYDAIASDLVLKTGFGLVFPEYTLAPEAEFPQIHEQVFSVLEWFIQNGRAHGLVPENFALVGDSAGGQIIFGVNVLAQKRQPQIQIPYNVLISPLTKSDDLAALTESEYLYFDVPFLTMPAKRKYMSWYIKKQEDRTTELASPIYISDETASTFAPSLIITSAVDPLRSEGEVFGQKLQQAGRDVTIIRADGQLHGSLVMEATRHGPTPQTLLNLIVAQLKSRLASNGKLNCADGAREMLDTHKRLE